VWAEALHLWRAGEPHWLDPSLMDRVNEHARDFEAADPLHELIEAEFPWHAWKLAGAPLGPWSVVCEGTAVAGSVARLSATQVLKQVHAKADGPRDTKRASDALRSLGAVKAPRSGAASARGWFVPVGEEYGALD